MKNQMATESILAEVKTFTTEQKISYLNQSINYWTPSHGYSSPDQYAGEWEYDSWNELLNGNRLDEIFDYCLNHDLNELSTEQIKDWLK